MYLFPNFNGATVEVLVRIRNFTPHFTGHVITDVSKRGPRWLLGNPANMQIAAPKWHEY